MKHVTSHIHLVFMYWMKHMTFQLSEHSSLHSFILFFLSYLNFILLQSYCSFILFFHALAAFYCHWEQWHFSKKEAFVTNTVLSWLLVSSDYSSCASQIYISVCSFIALRKFILFTHSYFESMCHYRVSESSYAYKHTGRCIEAFLCYFYNTNFLEWQISHIFWDWKRV